MPQIQNLEVMCAKDHMEVQLSFDKPFTGLVFSKGQFGHDNCVYVHPKSGRTNFRFSIIYNGCGTKPDAKGKFYENTVVVQYDEELIEVWDEAKRLRCEWYNDYEKTATKPPMVIADLEVVELNFRGNESPIHLVVTKLTKFYDFQGTMWTVGWRSKTGKAHGPAQSAESFHLVPL